MSADRVLRIAAEAAQEHSNEQETILAERATVRKA